MRRLALGLVAMALLASAATVGGHPAAADPAPDRTQQQLAQINGAGSTYVGLAMQQWTAEAQVQGLKVNYTSTNSPDGLSRYRGGQIDFAGTEAEFSSLDVGGAVPRGYQYVPDVAGAIAVMYNVRDLANRKVDYLHLSRRTVARIFMGDITSWADPAIAADNEPANLKLPDEPINVVYRSGQSGTTALFYDFVREMEPQLFSAWAAKHNLPTDVRIIQLDSSPEFAPRTQALSGSDQIAQFVASEAGRWSIAYDEFGYAKVYGTESAWIDNESGRWVLPYAENISAALDSATLREDLSQELSGVYRSTNPLAYPISAYSYIVTQCATTPERPTCAGPYSNPGVAGTLTQWLRYIACEGQIQMAQIGYSPLPPSLSQEVANSIARLNGSGAPEQLNAGNCANPRFSGSLGAGAQSPPDPYLGLDGFEDPLAPGPTDPTDPLTGGPAAGGGTAGGGTTGAGGTLGGPGNDSGGMGAGSFGDAAVAGVPGGAVAVGGGSGAWRRADPVAYPHGPAPASNWPVAVLAAGIGVPAVLPSVRRKLTGG